MESRLDFALLFVAIVDPRQQLIGGEHPREEAVEDLERRLMELRRLADI